MLISPVVRLTQLARPPKLTSQAFGKVRPRFPKLVPKNSEGQQHWHSMAARGRRCPPSLFKFTSESLIPTVACLPPFTLPPKLASNDFGKMEPVFPHLRHRISEAPPNWHCRSTKEGERLLCIWKLVTHIRRGLEAYFIHKHR